MCIRDSPRPRSHRPSQRVPDSPRHPDRQARASPRQAFRQDSRQSPARRKRAHQQAHRPSPQGPAPRERPAQPLSRAARPGFPWSRPDLQLRSPRPVSYTHLSPCRGIAVLSIHHCAVIRRTHTVILIDSRVDRLRLPSRRYLTFLSLRLTFRALDTRSGFGLLHMIGYGILVHASRRIKSGIVTLRRALMHICLLYTSRCV